MQDAPSLTVREYEPGDETSILRARKHALPGVRTVEEWEWAFRQNPEGARISLGVSEQGEVHQHQAAVPLRVRVGGESQTWARLEDSFFVAPGADSFLPAAKDLLGRHGAPAPDGDPIFFALPTREVHDVLKAGGRFECVRNQKRLVAEVSARTWAEAELQVEEATEFSGEVEELFLRVAQGRGAIGVRDAAFLTWRFVQRPGVDYRIALARGSQRELRGYAVYGSGEEGHGAVIDWLVPPDDGEASRSLLAFLGSCAVEDGFRLLEAWFPESAPEWLSFQGAGFRARSTPFYLIARSFQRPMDALWLYQNWYTTLADCELY